MWTALQSIFCLVKNLSSVTQGINEDSRGAAVKACLSNGFVVAVKPEDVFWHVVVICGCRFEIVVDRNCCSDFSGGDIHLKQLMLQSVGDEQKFILERPWISSIEMSQSFR